MPRPTHYSPAIDRFLVCCLYHEARRRRLPMTRLIDQILRQHLADTPGWRAALEQHLPESHHPGTGTTAQQPAGSPRLIQQANPAA
jgi:hypothetical protein